MKKLFFFLSLLLWQSFLIAQSTDSTKKVIPNTEIEKIHSAIGKILRKEYIELFKPNTKGSWLTTSNFEVKILKVTDATKNIELNGLRFEKLDYITKYSSTTHYAYIDSDEIPSLIKFLDFLETLENKTETNYTEYIYNSKDLQLFGYYVPSTTNRKANWVYGIQVDKYYTGSRANLSLKTIGELKSAIQENMQHFKIAKTDVSNLEG